MNDGKAFQSFDLGYLQAIWVPRFYCTVLAILLAAYLPEIGYTTFSHDYFYTLYLNYNAYAQDGRYLAEIVRLAFFGFLPPNLLLMLGLLCMVGCGIIFCYLLEVRHWLPVTIACCLFATFPMMFEIWSYASTRLTVPLAALLAMLALAAPSLLVGAVLICMALATYQSSLYLAVIVAVYVTAYRAANGMSTAAALRSFAVPRAIMVVVGLLLYGAVYLLATRYFHIGGGRLGSFVHPVADIEQFVTVVKTLSRALAELWGTGVLFFPSVAKYAFLALTALLLLALATNRRLVGILLVIVAPLFVFGAAWVTYPPNQMLFDRILFSFVGVYAGTFLLAWALTDPRLRSVVTVLGVLLVTIFVLQANIWHQFMDLRNRADMDMTQLLAARIRDLPDYRPGMAITLVGTLQDTSYLPYRLFDTSRGTVGNSMLASMYAYEWSSTRALMFFFPLSNFPSQEIAQSAILASADMPAWPAPESVAIRNKMVVVKLK